MNLNFQKTKDSWGFGFGRIKERSQTYFYLRIYTYHFNLFLDREF